jgi:ATP-dependent protease ClpP protease subunit
MPTKRPLQFTATASNGRAEIRLDGEISTWANSAGTFRTQLIALVASGIKDAHVYINTRGGNVFEANEIVNEVRRFPGKITGEGGALVASAGTNIMMHLMDFGMPKNGMVMIHKPSGYVEGNEDQMGSMVVALKKLTQQYRAMYAKAMGKSDEEVEALWAKGDVWLTAQEAKDMGLIARITDEVELDEEDIEDIAACGVPLDKLPTAAQVAITNKDDMDIKALRATLGMPDTATEAEVLARVNELKVNTERHLKAQDELRKAEVKSLIDAAVAARKITEAHRTSYEAKFAAAHDATKAELEGLTPAPKMGEVTGAAAATTGAKAGRDAWKYEDWASKDLAGLQEMMKSDPDRFKALYKERYGMDAKLPTA